MLPSHFKPSPCELCRTTGDLKYVSPGLEKHNELGSLMSGKMKKPQVVKQRTERKREKDGDCAGLGVSCLIPRTGQVCEKAEIKMAYRAMRPCKQLAKDGERDSTPCLLQFVDSECLNIRVEMRVSVCIWI